MDDTYQRLIALIELMSPGQLRKLELAIQARLACGLPLPDHTIEMGLAVAPPAAKPSLVPTLATIEATFMTAPECPHCQSISIQKWGSANGLKRYRCKACRVTFNALTGTPLAQLHKRELWEKHGQALIDGISLRKVVGRVGVSLQTAFRWRHRFMKAPKLLKAKKLEGTVEADETYFLYSEKGKRKLTRKARKRGGTATKRGLSAEQVPVLIARDRNKATTDQILPDRSEKSITGVLEPLIARDAVLVSDGARSYGAYANKAQILHVSLNTSEGEHSFGIYHIQNVNGYTSRLKTWIRRFNGVATKYLDTYLGWHRLADQRGSTLTAKCMLVAAIG
jgi:transposase-like protein